MFVFPLWLYVLATFMVKHSKQIEREYKITVTFTGIPWSDEYQDGVNRSAVDMLINGSLQADNAGIRKELEDAFKGQSDFMRYQSSPDGILWDDRGKVRTNRNALVFGDAISNSTDPLVTLLRILKDGKLGALSVDNTSLKMTEYVTGYLFGSWKTISGACSLQCCLNSGSIMQNRSCLTRTSPSCSGILLRRELSCVDSCAVCSVGQSTTTVAATVVPESTTMVAVSTQIANGSASPQMTTGVVPTPSSTSAAPPTASASPTSGSSMKPSCASISFIANQTWNASFEDTESELYKKEKKMMSMVMKSLYNDSKKYDNVEVSDVVFTEKDSLSMVKAKLCLVVKTNDGTLIEKLFIDKVKTGYLHADFPVKSASAEYKPEGVNFKDWKAKDCDICEGAGGEFVIERACEDDTYSCKGQKTTDMSNDCVKYCPSSAAAFTISSFILAMGIFLSFSFQGGLPGFPDHRIN